MDIFSLFRVDFHAVRLFFAYYGLFLRFLGNFLAGSGVGDKYGSILGFSTFCVFFRINIGPITMNGILTDAPFRGGHFDGTSVSFRQKLVS